MSKIGFWFLIALGVILFLLGVLDVSSAFCPDSYSGLIDIIICAMGCLVVSNTYKRIKQERSIETASLKCMLLMAASDGQISEIEHDKLNKYALLHGHLTSEIDTYKKEIENGNTNVYIVDDSFVKHKVLENVAAMMLIDNIIDEKESAAYVSIAKRFGIADDEANRILKSKIK